MRRKLIEVYTIVSNVIKITPSTGCELLVLSMQTQWLPVPGSSRGSLPGWEGTQRANGHCVCGSLPAHVFEGHWQWAFLVQHKVRHHQGEGGRHAKVCHKTDKERGHDTNRNGLLRILHFFPWRGNEKLQSLDHARRLEMSTYSRLTCGGNAVKPYEGIKTGGSTRQDSRPAKGHEATSTEAFYWWGGIRYTGNKINMCLFGTSACSYGH